MGKSEEAKQTSQPLPLNLNHDSQIKLIDLCTEKQGTYFKCENLSEFWTEVANSLDREFLFSITGTHVEGWVESICRPTREYLLRRDIFPHRAGREDLDIAIEDWLEIEGRRKFQNGFSEMITGYLLAYGPEESEEDDLLTYSCLNRLRENMDKVKTAMSEKGEASRRNGALLIHKVELLASKPGTKSRQEVPMPEEFLDCSQPRENLFPAPSPNLEIPPNPPFLDPTTAAENTSEGPSKALPRPPDELDNYQIPSMNLLSTEKPLESSIYSGAPHKNRAQGDKTAERPSSTYGNLIDESARSGDQNTTRQAPGEHEPECVTSCGPNVQVIHQPASGFPAIKKSALDLGGVAKSGSSKKSRGKKGKGVDRSRQFSIRDNSRSDADPDIPISSSTQDSMVVDSSQSPQSQQQSETWGEFTKSPRLRGQEYAEALTATPLKVLQKPRKRKGAGKRQTLSNKRHLVHINAANQSPSASQNTPTSLTRGSDNLLLDRQPSQTLTEGFSDTPCQDRVGKPVYNPLSNVPIIDLTRSPDQEIVKQELGWTTESLEVRMSRLTANLNGVASLTPEKIKEIIDHSVSARLSDAAHQVVEEFGKTLEKRMDQLRRDWRPLDDNRD